MINFNKQIAEITNEIKAQSPLEKNNKAIELFLNVMRSPKVNSCIVLDQFIDLIDRNQLALSLGRNELWQTVSKELHQVTNFANLMVLYIATTRLRITGNYIPWSQVYASIRKENSLKEFNDWLDSNDANEIPEIRSLLKNLISIFPNFISNQRIDPDLKDFDSSLIWLSIFNTRDRDDIQSVIGLVKFVKYIQFDSQYEDKARLLLQKIIVLLGDQSKRKGNLYLLFDSITLSEKTIEYFCLQRSTFLTDLDEHRLCNVFLALTRNGINQQIFGLIYCISHLLAEEQQYFTLRHILTQFILPTLARNAKAHKKMAGYIYELVLVYIGGFLHHINFGEEGVQCLLQNIEYIENYRLKQRWAELSLLACKNDKVLQEKIKDSLKRLGIAITNADQLRARLTAEQKIWKVTLRNGRRLKKYPEIDSQLKGIINPKNDCYMISVVQSLYLSDSLFPLLLKYQKDISKLRMTLIYDLFAVLERLKKRKDKISVSGVKESGPKPFRNSSNPEDAQEYLMMMLNQIEEELKGIPALCSAFVKTFKMDYIEKIICQNCNHTITKGKLSKYIHSFKTNQTFKFVNESIIEEYACEICRSTCKSQQEIVSRPDVLFMHINRFDYKLHGQKILGNKHIERKIENYRLAGFICHSGERISNGHYVFYGNIDKDRWAIFNDSRVTEISVPDDEQFEREFRAQNTPYILIYKRIN